MVLGTLMNICDNPNRVSISKGWLEDDVLRCILIIVTGGWQVVCLYVCVWGLGCIHQVMKRKAGRQAARLAPGLGRAVCD